MDRASLAAIAVVAAVSGGAMYFMHAAYERSKAQEPPLAELQRQLDAAKQQIAEAERARQASEQARLAAERASRTEHEARARGEREAQKRTAEERQRREEEANKSADAAKAEMERAVVKARAAAEREKIAERAAAARAAEPAEMARVRETLLQQAQVLERDGKGPAAVDLYVAAVRLGNLKAAARLGEIYRSGIPGVYPDPRKAADWDMLAKGEAPTIPPAGTTLYQLAEALELEGRSAEAVKMYIRAARSGDSKAALRLGEIYDKGIGGIARDYAESLKWYNAARVLGESVPLGAR